MSGTSPKFCLIGNGYIATRHISSIAKIGGELLMVCDIDPQRNIPSLPFTKQYEFLTALPRWNEVDYVVICTPNDLHLPIAKWANRHGKEALCEKPLGITVQDVQHVLGMNRINTVLQLRHHPLMDELKALKPQELELKVKVKREPSYWSGWKGDNKRSGGILYNLGVHYFDALMQICGEEYHTVVVNERTPKKVTGTIKFNGTKANFHIEIMDDSEGQVRSISVGGKDYVFSNRDNLSMEDLHVKVYEDLLNGKGIKPKQLYELTKLIHEIDSCTLP